MRHVFDTVHWNSVKLYRKNTDIVKLCNVKLFVDLSKNCQKYDSFSKFCFAPPTLYIGIQSKAYWEKV